MGTIKDNTMEEHRWNVLGDVTLLSKHAQTTKTHQKNIIELLNDIRDEPLAQAHSTGVYDELIEYLEDEFLMDKVPEIKPKIKIHQSCGENIYRKSNGKITQSKDAFEKSWIAKGYDYFSYNLDQWATKEKVHLYKSLGWFIDT